MSPIMVQGRQLESFRKNLLEWFGQYQRDLPWRRNKDAFRVWLSEIMLQQTRVAAVIPYYERFLERFPNLQALAEAPEDEVLRRWSGLGYYNRARNLQKAARQIVRKHAGEFPRIHEEALALPGIGKYTAAAILSIAYGQGLAVLDGNVARVLTRLGAVRGDIREAQRWSALQKTADGLLDQRAPGDWNQAMMELGATLCTPRTPQCLLCPVARFCAGRKLGIAGSLPAKRKKRAAVTVRLTTAVFLDRKGRTLLLPPPGTSDGPGGTDHVPTLVSKMWHFPTVRVNGNVECALRGFLRGLDTGFSGRSAELVRLKDVRHAVTYRDLRIMPFRVDVNTLPQIDGAKALPLEDVTALSVSNLTRKISNVALLAAGQPTAWA